MSHSNPESPLQASLATRIPVHGFADSYGSFNQVVTADVRENVALAAEELVQAAVPDLSTEEVLVSCFTTEYDAASMDETDARKLQVRSNVPKGGHIDFFDEARMYAGDDSSEANIIEQNIQALRDERLALNTEMARLHDQGTLTETARQNTRNRMAEINTGINALKAKKATVELPVYYATPFSGLRHEDAEDNPLGYAGDLPGTAYVAFYNAASMREAGIAMSNKSPDQVRIAARGRDIMRHCLAVMRVAFVDTKSE